MSRENVKKFYEMISSNESLARSLAELKDELEQGDTQLLDDEYAIKNKIIPLAKKYNLDFTVDEFYTYTKNKLLQLSEEELLAVTGGISQRLAFGFCAVALFSSLGTASLMNMMAPGPTQNQSILSRSAPAEENKKSHRSLGSLKATNADGEHVDAVAVDKKTNEMKNSQERLKNKKLDLPEEKKTINLNETSPKIEEIANTGAEVKAETGSEENKSALKTEKKSVAVEKKEKAAPKSTKNGEVKTSKIFNILQTDDENQEFNSISGAPQIFVQGAGEEAPVNLTDSNNQSDLNNENSETKKNADAESSTIDNKESSKFDNKVSTNEEIKAEGTETAKPKKEDTSGAFGIFQNTATQQANYLLNLINKNKYSSIEDIKDAKDKEKFKKQLNHIVRQIRLVEPCEDGSENLREVLDDNGKVIPETRELSAHLTMFTDSGREVDGVKTGDLHKLLKFYEGIEMQDSTDADRIVLHKEKIKVVIIEAAKNNAKDLFSATMTEAQKLFNSFRNTEARVDGDNLVIENNDIFQRITINVKEMVEAYENVVKCSKELNEIIYNVTIFVADGLWEQGKDATEGDLLKAVRNEINSIMEKMSEKYKGECREENENEFRVKCGDFIININIENIVGEFIKNQGDHKHSYKSWGITTMSASGQIKHILNQMRGISHINQIKDSDKEQLKKDIEHIAKQIVEGKFVGVPDVGLVLYTDSDSVDTTFSSFDLELILQFSDQFGIKRYDADLYQQFGDWSADKQAYHLLATLGQIENLGESTKFSEGLRNDLEHIAKQIHYKNDKGKTGNEVIKDGKLGEYNGKELILEGDHKTYKNVSGENLKLILDSYKQMASNYGVVSYEPFGRGLFDTLMGQAEHLLETLNKINNIKEVKEGKDRDALKNDIKCIAGKIDETEGSFTLKGKVNKKVTGDGLRKILDFYSKFSLWN